MNASPAADDEPGIGPFLARQRRLRGISLDDLSARTKIPRRSLERLEAGAFDRADDGFARGFVRTVADALGLDADEAVMRLLREPPEDEETASLVAPQLTRAVAIAAAVLLVAGLIGLGTWGLRAAFRDSGAEADPSDVLYRRDAVRALAASAEPPPPPPPPAAE